MTDVTTGATDAASAASLMAKPEPTKTTNSPWPGPPGMIPVTSGQADMPTSTPGPTWTASW